MDSVFVGTVLDSLSKRPLVNVTVTATSLVLQEQQVAFTDDAGAYRIPGLPAGTYELSFTMVGYRPFSRSGIPLHVAQTVRVNAELLPSGVG